MNMNGAIKNLLETNNLVLMEGSIIERMRRSNEIELHPTLVHSPLIYDEKARQFMSRLYQEYIDIALEAELPFLMTTPTWRANRERVFESNVSRSINQDAVRYMREIRDSQQSGINSIKIGGSMGCANDCYLPEEGLSASEAERFHAWQVEQLVEGGVDFLIAETLPNVEEATGLARAMEKSGVPYILSFVISRKGVVLNGTKLIDAVNAIDNDTAQQPLGYMISCSYPTFLCAANQPATLFDRLIGYSGNGSSLDHCDLEGADQLESEDVAEWGREMLILNEKYGIKVLSGCCGTDGSYLRYIVERRT